MKKLSILGLGTLAIMCACNSKPSTEYTINGTTDIPDGEMIHISFRVADDSTFKDSCAVANGAFTFTGTVETPKMAYISRGPVKYIDESVRPIMIEPGTITIALTGDKYSKAEVTGSAHTQQMDSLNEQLSGIYDQMKGLNEQYAAVQNDTAAVADLRKKYMALSDQVKEMNVNFVKTHPASYYSPVVMRTIKSDMTLDEIKEIYNSWTPEIQAADEATAKYIAALENIQPGAKAPEITGKDQNGNEVSLSGLKGKVVLLDFWATWCGPCRASLPHIKEVFEKYHDKGLEVLAVSRDRSEEPWKEYIANSGMGMENYVNIYDAPVNNAANYAIQYIPSKFIIDAEGNMVGRFDNPDELDTKLAEIFAGK
ncbi:MAG: AhpC/TSA family protein [Paenibacillus sp.]|nr:AhpC/TSA family protein [Paenibacillus sp.]